MNVVITGGAGFVGTNLAKRLLEEGHKVMVLDDYSVGKIENQIEGVKYIPMNIEQINYMSGEEVDVCFHLAALSRIQPSFENPSTTRTFEKSSLLMRGKISLFPSISLRVIIKRIIFFIPLSTEILLKVNQHPP